MKRFLAWLDWDTKEMLIDTAFIAAMALIGYIFFSVL